MKHFRSSDGLRLAYRDEGTGKPLLCLAGLTRDSRDFEYMGRHLDGVRMIMPDYRGRGQSEWDKNHENYSPAVEARDVIQLLDELEIQSTPILGTSRGGIVAMLLSATNGSRVSGVFLNDVGPAIEWAGLERIMGYVGRNPAAKSIDAAAEALASYSSEFSNVPDGRWNEECEKRFVVTADGLSITYDPGLRDAFVKAFDSGPPDLWPLYRTMNGIPISLLRGSSSDLLSRETAMKMKKVIPHLDFTEVPDRGHCPFLDESESLNAIRRFLTRVH